MTYAATPSNRPFMVCLLGACVAMAGLVMLPWERVGNPFEGMVFAANWLWMHPKVAFWLTATPLVGALCANGKTLRTTGFSNFTVASLVWTGVCLAALALSHSSMTQHVFKTVLDVTVPVRMGSEHGWHYDGAEGRQLVYSRVENGLACQELLEQLDNVATRVDVNGQGVTAQATAADCTQTVGNVLAFRFDIDTLVMPSQQKAFLSNSAIN